MDHLKLCDLIDGIHELYLSGNLAPHSLAAATAPLADVLREPNCCALMRTARTYLSAYAVLQSYLSFAAVRGDMAERVKTARLELASAAAEMTATARMYRTSLEPAAEVN